MKTLLPTILASLFLMVSAGQVRAQEELSCEDWRCQFQARLDADCACDGFDNHGRYVSCVAHIVKDLVAEGLPTNCKGKLKRCAAKSVCGKQDRGFATCTTVEYGTCLLSETGPNTCDTDPTIECTVDTDCVASSQCRITRHAERCEEAGGVLNLSPTCCSNCNTATAP
ncbi:MAG: hypothetical protein ABR538_05610 [Candidatus Binatia bacterium]